MARQGLSWLCLVVILFVSVWIRLEGATGVVSDQFTETDAYLYQHQAQIVSDQGHLPGRDLRRWVPLGRDTRQSLNLYPIVLGTAHRLLSFLFPGVSVYALVVYAPVFCFCVGIFVFCVFLAGTQGWGISLWVGVILATLPGTIERSASGFGDRDAFCLLLGISAVVTYLVSLRQSDRRWRCLWTLLSGFVMFLGGLAWEGFGVFLSVVVCVEVWRFLSLETEDGLSYFALWVLSFVPPLYLVSPAYRSGMGWSTHVFAFMLLPPVAVLAVRLLRYGVLEKSPWVETLSTYKRGISLGVLLFGFSVAGVYLLSIRETFALTTVAFGNTPLMQSIGELSDPHFEYWIHRYGSVFLIGSVGISLMPVCRYGRLGGPLSVALGAFCMTVFFRQPIASVCGGSMADGFFGCSLLAVLVTFIHLAWKLEVRPEGSDPSGRHFSSSPSKADASGAGVDPVITGVIAFLRVDVLTSVAMLAWGLFWLALARAAKRYDFFIGVALAYFTATLIRDVAGRVCATLRDSKWTTPALQEKLSRRFFNEVSVSVVLLCGVLVWSPFGGGHVFRTHAAAAHMRTALPGRGELAAAYAWMKTHLPQNAVVAAEWSYGTQLNVLGGVKTIVGPDHYLPSWIHLYHQHVERAKNEAEVIDFLFSHDATHLMMTTEKQAEGTLLRRGRLSGVFVEVYPEADFENAPVKVWQLQYPAGLQTQTEYLKTEGRVPSR